MVPKTSNGLKLRTTNGHKPSMEFDFCLVRQGLSQGWKPHPMLRTQTGICIGPAELRWSCKAAPLFLPSQRIISVIALDAFGGQGIC